LYGTNDPQQRIAPSKVLAGLLGSRSDDVNGRNDTQPPARLPQIAIKFCIGSGATMIFPIDFSLPLISGKYVDDA